MSKCPRCGKNPMDHICEMGLCDLKVLKDIKRIKVITLCGSTKFKKEFEEEMMRLTLEGNIVISVGVFGHADNIALTTIQKIELDQIHKRKIDMADAIHVINVDSYIGSSTKSEILYAKTLGKAVTFLIN